MKGTTNDEVKKMATQIKSNYYLFLQKKTILPRPTIFLLINFQS